MNLGIDGKEAVKIEKKGVPQMRGTPLYVNISVVLFLALLAWSPGLQLLEEVVALVVYEDECREVLNGDFPDGLHAQFGVLHALDALDGALRQHGSHAADGAQVESAVLLAGIRHHLAAVALGYHHEACAVILELVYIRIHAVGGSRAHGATGVTLGSLCRTGVEDGMILEVLRHVLTGIETRLQLGVCYVAGHDDGALEVDTRAHGVLGELGTHGIDALVEVYLYALGTLTGAAQLLGDKL